MYERHQSGFIPLILFAFFVGSQLKLTIPQSEPVNTCLMKHSTHGRDAAGVTIMKHWRPCHANRPTNSRQSP